MILFDRIRGWRVYRTLVFTPYILAVPVIGATFVYLYGFNGIVNTLLRDCWALAASPRTGWATRRW